MACQIWMTEFPEFHLNDNLGTGPDRHLKGINLSISAMKIINQSITTEEGIMQK